MAKATSPSALVVGLALFSMFFGSGNLIFPLMLGAKYQAYFYICALGFVITAVALPTLGLMAMIPLRGRYEDLFSRIAPIKYTKYFFLAVLLFWIPLGSGPRCVVLAYASIHSYVPDLPPLWLFSAFFLAIVYICLIKRGRVITLLGKILTPLLLISIACMVISSLLKGGDLDIPSESPRDIFISSLIDGYYTQDLIAAIFFSSTLLSMLMAHDNPKRALQKTWQGGLIAVTLLAILYGALMASSAIHGEFLVGLSGERLVSQLAQITLGNTFGGISSIAVSLACLTTEIALVLVFADFIAEHFMGNKHRKIPLISTLLIIWFMSLLRFDGIMAIVAPAMQLIYPVLFFLVLKTLWQNRRSHS